MHSVIFISIRNIESKRNIEQNKFTNRNNLFPNPIYIYSLLDCMEKDEKREMLKELHKSKRSL